MLSHCLQSTSVGSHRAQQDLSLGSQVYEEGAQSHLENCGEKKLDSEQPELCEDIPVDKEYGQESKTTRDPRRPKRNVLEAWMPT